MRHVGRKLCFAASFCIAVLLSGRASGQQLVALEPGGSNYPMYSVGDYLQNPTLDRWYAPGNLRPVIGTYAQDPSTVALQLQTMWNQGQRKIALVLWYADFSPDATLINTPVYGHVVNSKNGALLPDHQSNLIQLLQVIRQTGFNELVFRFATQGASDPRVWAAWDEAAYTKNRNFITSTKSIIDSTLATGAPRVVYDLDVELGGISDGQAGPYARRLWHDFVLSNGTGATLGFSFAFAPGRFTAAIANFDVEGIRPQEYAFDIYGNESQAFATIKSEMGDAGELAKPIVVLESYHNDAVAGDAVAQARDTLGLNVRTLFQWPLDRGATQPHFSMQYASGFDAYLSGLFATPGVPLVSNGTFSAGSAGWKTYALPTSQGMSYSAPGGVFQWSRSGTQAVVFQESGIPIPAGGTLRAQFYIGNSSSVRRRMTVLIHDANFADLSVCTFTLQPSAPLQQFSMTAHATRAWGGATLSFYAADVSTDSGVYQLDDVAMARVASPEGSTNATLCSDPRAPDTGAQSSDTLIVNGSFGAGLSPWVTYGMIQWRLNSGVFEFYKASGTPSGVILQRTGAAMAQAQPVALALQLGNSSTVRQRVTLLLHDGDFSDITACTFWLPPSTPLGSYSMRTYATKPWGNATVSIYPATVGSSPTAEWLQLDNVAMASSASGVGGTECLGP